MSLVSEARSLGRIYTSLAFKGLKLCDFFVFVGHQAFFYSANTET